MSFKVLIIADPIEELNPNSDSSFFMAKAAIDKGFSLFWCEAKDVFLLNTDVFVDCKQITAAKERKTPILAKKNIRFNLVEFASIWIRKNPPFDETYISLCWLLSLVENKVSILNLPSLLLQHHEKLLPFQAVEEGFLHKSDILPTLVNIGPRKIKDKDFERTSIVQKPWLGFGGRGIEKKKSLASALRSDPGRKKKNSPKYYIYQPFIKEISEWGDRRVFFFDGEYIGDFVRLPKKKSIISNLAQGGTPVIRERSPQEKDLCNRIGSYLKARGIFLAGADLIGPFLTEINITSPTGLVTLSDLGIKSLEKKFLDMVEDNIKLSSR